MMNEFFSSNFQQMKMSDEKTGDSMQYCLHPTAQVAPRTEDPLNWAKAARAMDCSHWEEVFDLVQEFQNEKEVVIQGVTLTVAQAVDLRHLEENMQVSVQNVVSQAAKKTLFTDAQGCLLPSRFCEKDLLKVVDNQPPFSYIDDATSASYPLMQKLRQCLVSHALSSENEEERCSVFRRISVFEEQVKTDLEATVAKVREQFDNGVAAVPNRISDCRSYPLYDFVRSLGTKLLVGTETRSPGQDIELVYEAISQGKMASPLIQCLAGWNGCSQINQALQNCSLIRIRCALR
ncbi:hypothetical protein AXG93_3833s1040 [Marchantia polymorpha subsp. ruderalis]|uniref:Phenylalanine ammonia-lyase n=1 Tax=Marchantia polymorpha subsp. ruderalis TaxID=1480154 RepID=A0A176VN62_MARPO|nr:hypothetical protein AXG93_3833s1040 [Marchantia polymorpha subsp. ruderalis]